MCSFKKHGGVGDGMTNFEKWKEEVQIKDLRSDSGSMAFSSVTGCRQCPAYERCGVLEGSATCWDEFLAWAESEAE